MCALLFFTYAGGIAQPISGWNCPKTARRKAALGPPQGPPCSVL